MKNHEDYKEYAERWKKCRAFAFGDEHEIKELHEEVIPMQVDEDKTDYAKRVDYAHVDNKVAASMWIYRGLAFRKNPVLSKLTEKQQVYIDNIDGSGMSVIDLAKKLHSEHLAVTRYGLLIDGEPVNPGESHADYVARGGRHKICMYTAESILDWSCKNGIINYVLLKEKDHKIVFNPAKNEFEQEHKDVYRTLDTLDGYYRVMLWRKKEGADLSGGSEFELIEEPQQPTMNGAPLAFIPFNIYPDTHPSTPMIQGLVDANIAHLKADAMDSNLCRLIATPTPYFAGFSELSDPQKNTKVNLSSALVTNNPNARCGYLEMAGAGAAAIQARMARLLDEMVAEGSSLLRSSPKAVESAESAGIRNMGDNSKLSEVSLSVESAINWAVNLMLEWDSIDGEEFKLELNRDMLPYPMSPQQIDSLVRSYQTGAISYQTLFYNLAKGEIIEQGRTAEEEQGALTEGM